MIENVYMNINDRRSFTVWAFLLKYEQEHALTHSYLENKTFLIWFQKRFSRFDYEICSIFMNTVYGIRYSIFYPNGKNYPLDRHSFAFLFKKQLQKRGKNPSPPAPFYIPSSIYLFNLKCVAHQMPWNLKLVVSIIYTRLIL